MSALENICTPCGTTIGPGEKYLALYFTPGGLLVKEGCSHRPCLGADVYLSSFSCAQSWWASFLRSRQNHVHPHKQNLGGPNG